MNEREFYTDPLACIERMIADAVAPLREKIYSLERSANAPVASLGATQAFSSPETTQEGPEGVKGP